LQRRADVPLAPPAPPSARTGADLALDVAVAGAIALALALWDSRFHVVPTAAGSWRGISDPPSLVRVVLSLLGGAAGALATRGSPRRWRTPLVGFALAGAPLVPVYTGHALALLALQGPILTLVVGVSIAVALARAMLRGE